MKVILLTQPDGTVSQVFQYDAAPIPRFARVLVETAETLSAAHTGLRVELADGFS